MIERESCRGARGYSENAEELIGRYEAISFLEKHGDLLPLIPANCSRVLDIGAGAGGDAAWLADRHYDVVAVEPTAQFRNYASRRYSSKGIEWIDDHLPHLRLVSNSRRAFDLIVISAVWMHLEAGERSAAMQVLTSLLSVGGVLYISLRHGPIPEGRTMFDVSAAETVTSANAFGLDLILHLPKTSVQRANREAGVSWSQLAFLKRTQNDG
jgi:SAM-dependent methyltransferase